jgi:hypothetical protein
VTSDADPGESPRRRRSIIPTSFLGRWAVGLGLLGVILVRFEEYTLLGPYPGYVAMLIGAIFAVVAIARRGERSPLAWLAMVPLLVAIALIAREVLERR